MSLALPCVTFYTFCSYFHFLNIFPSFCLTLNQHCKFEKNLSLNLAFSYLSETFLIVKYSFNFIIIIIFPYLKRVKTTVATHLNCKWILAVFKVWYSTHFYFHQLVRFHYLFAQKKNIYARILTLLNWNKCIKYVNRECGSWIRRVFRSLLYK